MRNSARLAAVLVSAGVMVILLLLGVRTQTAANTAGSIIKVPDDYATIQAAIDAAVDGDTILVAQDNYKENLSITKGITLSGGWNDVFTSRDPWLSVIDGQGIGRVISITCPSSDTLVTIDGFTIERGNASGLGGPEIAAGLDSSELPPSSSPLGMNGDDLSHEDYMTGLRQRTAALAGQGLYPGGSGSQEELQERLEWIDSLVEAAQTNAGQLPDEKGIDQGADYGGGIYSFNASLHLLNSRVQFSLACEDNDAYGGGIFIGNTPPDGVLLENNLVQYNTASLYADGKGGGLYISQAPGAVLQGNQFLENAASSGGQVGVGGGIYVNETPGLQIMQNTLARNTAHASWNCPPLGGGGTGGAIQLRMVENAVVNDNDIHDNLAALHCGSHGGGLYVYRGEDIQISDNRLSGNMGVVFQVYSDDFGGGMGLDTSSAISVTGNQIESNTLSMNSASSGMHVSYGGGIFVYDLDQSQFLSNTITANVASTDLTGYGGGIYLAGVENVDIVGNTVSENVASISGEGKGGGIDLLNAWDTLIQFNRLERNLGSVQHLGYGGALNVERWGPQTFDTQVDGNLFLDNQASGDPSSHSIGGACQALSDGFLFSNNVVAGNRAAQAGGLDLGWTENGEVTNNTFSGNHDVAVLVDIANTTPITLTNNIVVSHTVGVSVSAGTTATVRYTLWNSNGSDLGGSGTISHTHPVTGTLGFVDPGAGDYHTTGFSAAVDAGDPAGAPPAPDHDADGAPRPHGMGVDLGAYEWQGYRKIFPAVYQNWTAYHGWAVGQKQGGYGVIIHTTDGGQTWERQGDSTQIPDVNINSVAAIDEMNAWAVGGQLSDGIILRTQDGGRSWQQQTIPPGSDVELLGIYALDGDTAWAAGQENTILHTTDGGQIWAREGQGAVAAVQLQGVYASDASNAWSVGDNEPGTLGTVVRTTDGGATWNQVPYTLTRQPIQSGLIDVHGNDADTVWVVGPGQVSHTSDGGQTWDDQWFGAIGPDHVNGVFALDQDHIWIAVDYGGIYFSDDGGRSWQNQTNPVHSHILRISALDTQTAWAVSTDPFSPFTGDVLKFSAADQAWYTQTTPVETEWSWVSFVK